MRISWNGIEPFASLLEWDKRCCSLGRIYTWGRWTFQRHFRTRGSPKAFEQISDCQLIYPLMLMTMMEFTWIFIQQSMAYGFSHNQILRHPCEKPGSMENKAFKSFILLRNLTPQERVRRCQIPGEDLYLFFLSNLTRPMMFRKWTPTWMRMWDPRTFC